MNSRTGPEEQLMLLTAGTEERRARCEARMRQLISSSDQDRLLHVLEAHGVVGVVGTRLLAFAPSAMSFEFRDQVETAVTAWRRRSLLLEATASKLIDRLTNAGIRCASLKGTFLVKDIYGDPGLRTASDIDLLVDPGEFQRAIAVLAEEGYRQHGERPWLGELPLFEAALLPPATFLPPIDLHWRLHWYEDDFAARYLARSIPAQGRGLRPDLADELMGLLLHYARDGLTGLRVPLDIGAWWDRHGAQLPDLALDSVAQEHPRLRRVAVTAATAAARLVGLPVERLFSEQYRSDVSRLALRIMSSTARSHGDFETKKSVVDMLLAPVGERPRSLARYLRPPASVIQEVYELRAGGWARQEMYRLRYGAIVGARLIPHAAQLAWRSRKGGDARLTWLDGLRSELASSPKGSLA